MHESQKQYWKKSTADSYEKYIGRLHKYFADLPLRDFQIEQFREYQKINSVCRDGDGPPLVPSSINHDLNTLAQILNQAGLWEEIRPFYKPLPLPGWTPPRVLTEEEENRFFEIAGWCPARS